MNLSRLQHMLFRIPSQKIYIMPNAYGFVFAFGVNVMFWVSVGFGNNLGFLLCFLLASSGFAVLLQTHGQISRMSLGQAKVHDGQVGRGVPLFLPVLSSPGSPLYLLDVHVQAGQQRLPWSKQQPLAQLSYLEAGGRKTLEMRLPVEQAGIWPSFSGSVGSRFPLGLFWCWKPFSCSGPIFVYPRAHGSLPLPMQGLNPLDKDEEDATPQQAQRGQTFKQGLCEDFVGHKTFEPGDQLRRINWRILAARGESWVKVFDEDIQPADCALSEALCRRAMGLNSSSKEQRTAIAEQLSAWVQECKRDGRAFSLKLPGESLALGQGEYHYVQAMRALTRYAVSE